MVLEQGPVHRPEKRIRLHQPEEGLPPPAQGSAPCAQDILPRGREGY